MALVQRIALNLIRRRPSGKDSLAMHVVSIAEAEERRDELEQIVAAWIALRDAED